MKPIALAIALLVSSAAFAQSAPAPAKKPDAAPAASANPVPGGSDVVPVVSAKPGVFSREVNPFTGKPLSGEELQARLEASKLLTQQLEEQLKQVTLAGEIEGVPARKGAETATARAAQRKEELKLAEMEAEASAAARARAAEAKARADAEKAAKAAAKAAAKEDARRKKLGLPSLAEEAAAKAAAQAAAKPSEPMGKPVLVSVQRSGSAASALFEQGGAALLVADGENSPMGVVRVLDAQTVEAGGVRYKVNGYTLSRFAAPEQPVRAAGAGGVAGAAAPVPARAVASGPSSVPAMTTLQPLAGDDGKARVESPGVGAKLPPLQIPPGVQVLPSAR